MTDTLTPEKRSWNMSRIKSKDTKPEIIVRSLLHRAGFRFRVHVSNLPGKPDIVLPRYKTVIFVNGCFWHHHKNCNLAYIPKTRTDFWTNKFKDTAKRDAEKIEKLRRLGWQVLTIWECELKKDPANTIQKVVSKLKAKFHSP